MSHRDPVASILESLNHVEEAASIPLDKILGELEDATLSAQKEFNAIWRKLAPHASQTAPQGSDIMMLRTTIKMAEDILLELRKALSTEFPNRGR